MSVLKVYNPIDIEVDHGDGVYLYAIDGTRFLDFTSGIGVNCLGHSHPSLVNALKSQGEKIWHCSNLFKVVGQETVADKLVKNSFASDVFFCNSGSEATETSIKVARKFFYEKGYTSKNRIITFEGAFHGRTLASLFAAKNPDHIRGFGPDVEGFDQVPFGDHEALEKTINKDTAAIMIETIMGEGGIRVIPEDCLKGLRKLCDERNILLILDEVQCGLGRTGKLFALNTYGVTPDILCIAKGMGGGMAIGAFISSKENMDALKDNPKLGHITTFGGHPVSCAAALSTLQTLLNNSSIINSIPSKEKLFRKGLEHSLIKEIRGIGLMLAIELGDVEKCRNFVEKAYKKGLITFFFLFTGTAVRLSPPLIITEKEIQSACEKIQDVLDEL